MTNEELQKSQQQLWKEHFSLMNELEAMWPEIDNIEYQHDIAENLGVPEKKHEVEIEIKRLKQKLFILELRYVRNYSLLLMANVNKFAWN